MPSIGTIVDVNISVQSSQLTRKGFNSLMLVGDYDDFGAGFSEHEVRIYENYEAVIGDTDIVDGKLKSMLQIAFSQSPSVPKVYVSMFDSTGDGGTSGAELLQSLHPILTQLHRTTTIGLDMLQSSMLMLISSFKTLGVQLVRSTAST